jgi:hypothetical protein
MNLGYETGARNANNYTITKCVTEFVLVIAFRTRTPKYVRGSWSHYTDTSEPVDGNGAQNMVTVKSGFEPATFRSVAHELTNCSNRAHLTELLRRRISKHFEKKTFTKSTARADKTTTELPTLVSKIQTGT